MAREKTLPPDESGNVPLWFMTYSDVITLLMTFFILLLTFATSEPEKFEQMKVSMFGANGGTGFASELESPIEMDSLVMRYRPDSSRLTTRGTETPLIHDDPAANSMSKGLEGLEQELQYPIARNYAVKTNLSLMIDRRGRITQVGLQQLRMLARQMKRGPHNLTLQVTHTDQVRRATTLATYMSDEFHVDPSRIAVGFYYASPGDESVRIFLSLGHRG